MDKEMMKALEDEWHRAFNGYLDMAIREGWSDPVGFANRRMAELELESAAPPGHASNEN